MENSVRFERCRWAVWLRSGALLYLLFLAVPNAADAEGLLELSAQERAAQC